MNQFSVHLQNVNDPICFAVCAVIDGMGLYGHFLHYGIVIALVGSAFLIFLCLWKKKRLDIDEEPKFQMMREERDQEEHKEDR